ncbi:DUF4384 domain-containing protein [Paraburkholderia sp. 35.1]|uniref:DUF4384 domain-containing protein n=1 Tax=unclassified Paraburkholderia TaxID=2615204 RepID=UPI003D25C858
MDEMLASTHQTPIRITSKSIADPSGKAGTSVKDLVITALAQMSERSKTFEFVDYEINLVQQDTVQYLSSLLLGMNAMNIEPPQVYVSGAVSYIDENVVGKRRSLGISADGSIRGHEFSTDLAYDGDVHASIIALELHLGELRTRTLVPGIYAANSAIVAKSGSGIEGGGTIFKTGVQFSLSNDHSQGSGLALRSLVDLGMIELVGKWLKLPYWQCLSLNEAAPEFQRELRTWYDAATPAYLTMLAQTVLRRETYYDGPVDGISSTELKAAIAEFQMDQDIPSTGLLSFPTYQAMLAKRVPVDVHGNVQKVDLSAVAPASDALSLKEGGQGPIDVTLSAEGGDHPRVGDELNLDVRLNRSAALRCYYEDASHTVTQIYPNPFEPMSEVQAYSSTSIPVKDKRFSIRFEKPGHEEVLCFAANASVFEHLPSELKGPGLETITGFPALVDITNAMLALNAPSLSVGRLNVAVGSR